jgi:hypothetical protein
MRTAAVLLGREGDAAGVIPSGVAPCGAGRETVIHFADDAYITPSEARKLAEALVELTDGADGLR